MIYNLLLAALTLCHLVVGQTCASGKTIEDFQKCLEKGLVSNTGKPTKTPEEACNGLKDIPWQFYGCLCIKEKVVVQCYAQFCASDPSWSAYQGAQVAYCTAAESNPIPAGQTIPGVSNVTITPTTSGISSPTGTGGSKTSSASSPDYTLRTSLYIALGVEAFILLALVNIM
ncbi:hypothetical protein BC833DRAFT_646694 [Globomyces pollinis-pini]|nr:hypothetical protein BC833DRAFT_646694 [Globomyces pollinis-pini]